MIGFETYTPEKWQTEGAMTVHIGELKPTTVTREKRTSGALAVMLRASIVGLGICVSPLSIGQGGVATASATVMERKVDAAAAEGSEVPDGYWERLLARLQSGRPIVEEASFRDPEPLA